MEEIPRNNKHRVMVFLSKLQASLGETRLVNLFVAREAYFVPKTLNNPG
jgi:hypothetical protein